MKVLAIDSAEVSGWALLDGERLVGHGAVRVRTAAEVDAAASELAAYVPDVVAVEEPFVHPRNPSTGLVLARLLGRWLQAFEGRGFAAVTVPASMWQPAVLPGITNRSRSTGRKAAAIALARDLFAVEVGEDAADAIGLAVYVARNVTRRAA
jgi:Holliday junction resolvasome RuvABC endonuclease subunit